MPVTSLTTCSSTPSAVAVSKSPHQMATTRRTLSAAANGARAPDSRASSDVTGAHVDPAVDVPECEGCVRGEGTPVQPVISRHPLSEEGVDRLTQARRRLCRSVKNHGYKTFEEEVTRFRAVRRRTARTSRDTDVDQPATGTCQATGHQGGGPGVEIGVSREPGIQRLESRGGFKQLDRGAAAGGGGPADLSAELLRPGSLQVVDRVGLRLR